MADVFISYARSTAEPARAIAETLRMGGYSVWIDDDLPAHRDFPTAIEENLRAAKAVLVIWSEDARKSRWVPAEADVAHKANTLVQLSLDNVTPPLPFNRVQCTKMPDWKCDFERPGLAKGGHQHRRTGGPRRRSNPNRSGRRKTREAQGRPPGRAALRQHVERRGAGLFLRRRFAEEIQQTVAQGSDLKVLARSSSFQFRGAEKVVRKVAASLNATHVLDGSVRRKRVPDPGSPQDLIECEGETTLWANRFDGDLSDVFDLQDRIAEKRSPRPSRSALAPQASVAGPRSGLRSMKVFLKARAVVTEARAPRSSMTPRPTRSRCSSRSWPRRPIMRRPGSSWRPAGAWSPSLRTSHPDLPPGPRRGPRGRRDGAAPGPQAQRRLFGAGAPGALGRLRTPRKAVEAGAGRRAERAGRPHRDEHLLLERRTVPGRPAVRRARL